MTRQLKSVQDFLIKLDIKPLMHLFEISTFPLNNVIVRPTKIMNLDSIFALVRNRIEFSTYFTNSKSQHYHPRFFIQVGHQTEPLMHLVFFIK